MSNTIDTIRARHDGRTPSTILDVEAAERPRDPAAPLHIRRTRRMRRAVLRLEQWIARTCLYIVARAAEGALWAVEWIGLDRLDSWRREVPRYGCGLGLPSYSHDGDESIWPSVCVTKDAQSVGRFWRACRDLANEIASHEGRAAVRRPPLPIDGSVRGIDKLRGTLAAAA